MTQLSKQINDALRKDRTIDIITTGARTGLVRKTEIWFTRVGERIIICGTPAAEGGSGPYKPRHWLANLKANPQFLFCLKESVKVQLPATALIITDPEDRRMLMSSPATQWYRSQVDSVDELVRYSPIVEVFFTE